MASPKKEKRKNNLLHTLVTTFSFVALYSFVANNNTQAPHKAPQNLLYADTNPPIERVSLYLWNREEAGNNNDNEELIENKKSFAPFITKLDACRKKPKAYPLVVQNAVKFVDLTKKSKTKKHSLPLSTVLPIWPFSTIHIRATILSHS